MRFLRRSLVSLFLLSLAVGLLVYAGQSLREALESRWAEQTGPRPARERIFSANVITFRPGVVTPVMTVFGEVRSRRTLELRARSAGSVVELADSFEEGGSVNAGQLLLRVDPVDAEAALEVALADLAEAEAALREAVSGLSLAGEDVAAAREQLALREQALTRRQQLSERGVGTAAAVETAALAEVAAKQAVLSRRQALAQAEARVDQAETSLLRRRIARNEAERRLADTELYAEFSGTLSEVGVVEGGLVQANERVAKLVDPDALEVVFRVSVAEYARLLNESGALIPADVEVTLDVLGVDLTTLGRIGRESAGVETGQTGRLLFAQLQQATGFRPGDFVSVRIREPDLSLVATLPATAVDSSNSVLVVGDGDRLQVAEVSLLRRQGDSVIVRAPDLVGRDIVAERSPLLGAGIRVRPVRAQNATIPDEPEMVELTDERRAKLVEFIEGNRRMPAEVKARILERLSQRQVPAEILIAVVDRLGGGDETEPDEEA